MVIGFVGRLDVYTKGLDLLLAAFREFQKSHPAASLWIIGDGPGREWMTKYIQGNHLQNVVLWGKKFGLEKDTLLRQMHVFAHPSRNEGLPNAVLEAAALGVPSVVTAATNVARIVGEYQAGIAVKNESVEHLHQAFISMYRHYASGSAPALSANAYQMVQSAFSWKNLVHQYDQLYL